MSDDIAFPGISELGARYRARTLSPVEVTRESLARLHRLEPELNAFAHVMDEIALVDAELAAAELAGGDRGALHGIPVAIKDLIDVAGVPTGFGSKVRSPQIATKDAELVSRLRAAGAIIIGKTNLLEYAYGIAHPEIGQTNNPHDPARTSGGSSGGSAAAVAAGIVPLAIGTDTGGSVRIPAAYCGIVGLKPSFGLVPLDGVFPLSQSLDHAGPLTRSIEDAALALSCLTGQMMPISQRPLDRLKVGVIRRHFESNDMNREFRARMDDALAALAASGATLVDVTIPGLPEANRELVTILHPEASLIHADLLTENPGGYAPGTRAQIEAGFKTTATDYLRALAFRETLRTAVESVFDAVDVLLSPSVPFIAPLEDPVIEDGQDGEMLSSGFANVTGHPALSLPYRLGVGMPVGMQLVGRLGGDIALLSAAQAFEQLFAPTLP